MVDKIINEIEKGNLVVMPTDTIYGIIADATREDVIKKVYEVKKRDYNKPLLILVSNWEMLNSLVLNVPDMVKKIANKYWPGPLTILFEKSEKVSDLLTAKSPFVAIRMPKDDRLIEIMNKMNKPLISTSANISSHSSITNPKQLEDELKLKIDLIVDEGTINNDASTLIKVENNKIVILREGSLVDKIRGEYLK